MAGTEVCHGVHFGTVEMEASADRETLVSLCRQARMLYWRALDSQNAEREAVARQLHDDLAQKLTALSIELGLQQQRAANGGGVGGAASGADGLGLSTAPLVRWVQEAIQAAKQLEIRLRPRWQEGTTLNAALGAVVHDFENRTGHPVLFRCSPHDIGLDRPKSLALVRLLEEALVHAVEHSQASRMEVWLSADEAGVRLGIQDNGTGRVEADSEVALSMTSWNLQLSRFQGSLQVMAIPADGTLVVIRLPTETGSNLAVRSVC